MLKLFSVKLTNIDVVDSTRWRKTTVLFCFSVSIVGDSMGVYEKNEPIITRIVFLLLLDLHTRIGLVHHTLVGDGLE